MASASQRHPRDRTRLESPIARPAWRRYGVAVASVALSWVIREALTPVIGPTALPFITFFPAVAMAAWYGGLAPAVLSVILAALASNWSFLEPLHGFGIHEPVALVAFLVAALFIVGAVESMHRARRELASARDVLSTTLQSIGDGVVVTDAAGHVTFLNLEAERLTGWTRGEADGRPLAEVFRIVNEESRQTVESPVEKVLRLGVVVGLANHTVLVSRDGHETPIDDSAAPIQRSGEPVLGVVLVFRDVRDQRAAAEARARLAAIVDSTGDAILSKDLDGTIRTWNAGAERMFGYRAEEIVGRSIAALVPQDRADEERGLLERLRQGHGTTRLHTVRTAKDGRRIDVSITNSALRGLEGEVRGASTIFHDLTEVLSAQDALAREKELLRTTLASIGDAVIATDPEGHVTFLNPVASALTGWGQEEADGRPLPDVFRVVDESTRQSVENPALRAMREGVIQGLTNHSVLIARDGGEHPIDDSAAPIRDGRGRIVGSVLVFRDVREKRRVEIEHERLRDELAVKVQELQAIFEIAPVQIWIGDAECKSFHGNRRAYEQHGLEYGINASFDAPVLELPPGLRLEVGGRTLQPDEMPMQVAARTGQAVHDFEHDVVRPDGERRTMWANVAPLFRSDGQVRGVVGAYVDVTVLRAAERALREADQRKNEFLALLAHELRNPLAPIRNSISLLQMKGPQDHELVSARDVIERQVGHMSRLLDDLLDVNRLSRQKLELRREQVTLATVVESAIETAGPSITHGRHRLSVELPSRAVTLDADPLRLAQVFANLLNNAAKYMDPGGRIVLTAVLEGTEVLVSVEDTGIGIEPAALGRLFEMFAQAPMALERSQGGVGIGLALAKRIVEMHGGTISARSDGLGRGSVFAVRLPVTTDASPPPSAAHDPERRSSLPRRILIADDVRDNADTLATLLRALGHEVQVTYDGQAAVAAAEKLRPEVVLLDIGMPGLNGYEACRRIRAQPWGVNMYLIAQTGWGQDVDRLRAKEAGFDRHMLKPIDCASLLVVLAALPRAALDA